MHQYFEQRICKDASLFEDKKQQVVSHHVVRLLDLGELRQQTLNFVKCNQQNQRNHPAIKNIEDTVVYAR
jgi:hypothetical protein